MHEDILIEELKAGKNSAFRFLLNEYGDRVYNTCLSLVQNEQDAQEAVQDVFTQVFRSIGNFRGDSKLSTWIYRISTTTALGMIRKRKSRPQPKGDIDQIQLSSTFYHPGISLERKEKAAILFAAIDTLPENQKTAFVLNKIEYLSYNEIAEVMQLSLSAIESLLFRAKQNLKQQLTHYYKNEM